jgi:CubicO group peptidase (beta-lactamase class C family)
MSLTRLAAAAVLAVSVALPAAAQGIPKAQSPEEVGFLSTRLKRISDRINEGVKNNELPGAVVLIARNGKLVMFESFGFRDKDAKAPMTNDTIFRIASMTKPIVTVAAMILAEEGKLTVADPVSRYIPAFADTKVAVPKKNADGTVEITLEPQTRAMTVQDLMRHTSGLTYGAIGTNPVKQSYLDMKMADRGQTNAEMVDKRQAGAALPARHDLNIDVDRRAGPGRRGRLGMPLDKFIEERITKPLKMGDTAEVPPTRRRAAPADEGGAQERDAASPRRHREVHLAVGGGGMVSTAADYALPADVRQWRPTHGVRRFARPSTS